MKDMPTITQFIKEATALLLQLTELQSQVEQLVEQNKNASYLRDELKECLATYNIALNKNRSSLNIQQEKSIAKNIDLLVDDWLSKQTSSLPQSVMEQRKRRLLESITQEIGHLLYVKSLFNRPRDIAKFAEELLQETHYQEKNNLSGIHFLNEDSYWYKE